MGRRHRTEFGESLAMNQFTWRQYYDRLRQLSMVMFEYEGMPEEIDQRFLEKTLFNKGNALFFRDDEMGKFLCLPSANLGKWSVYDVPKSRRAYASNGYQRNLTDKDSVIIYNNYLRTPSRLDVEMFAKRLYNIDRAIDVNVNGQKTPLILLCEESERLSYLNLYKEYDGGAPIIKGTKDLDLDNFRAVTTGAPYVADKLYDLKTQMWNEALTYLGIVNVSFQKRERMVTDEVDRMLGGTYASRYSRLLARQQAFDQINEMYGLNIVVKYRDEFDSTAEYSNTQKGGEDNE